MPDLIIVGAGFWGAALAEHARARGLETVVVDDGAPASGSRNAAGLCRPSWCKAPAVPAWWQAADWAYSRDWLGRVAALELCGEQFASWRRPAWRPRRDLFMVPDPGAVLACAWPLQVARVQGVTAVRGQWMIQVQGGAAWMAPRLAVAAGIETDTLLFMAGLAPVGVQAVRGRGLIGRTAYQLPQPETFQVRPYLAYTARAWCGSMMRCGDTTEPGGPGQWRHGRAARQLQEYVLARYPDFEIRCWHDGLRPVCPDGPVVQLAAPGCVVATGGGRIGLALAAPVARRALGLLGLA